jgi:ribosomal protein S18 acetylase RimI-like enzyme
MITHSKTQYRPARRDDALAIVELFAIAGRGIPEYVWSLHAVNGRSATQIAIERVSREDANFSYRNVLLAEREGEVVGMLLGYTLREPTPAEIIALDTLPPVLRPMVALEQRAPGTFYINALAVREEHRGNGIGSKLLYKSRQKALEAHTARITVEVFEQNEGALRLYERHGFRILDRCAVVRHPCHPYSGELLLMVQNLN